MNAQSPLTSGLSTWLEVLPDLNTRIISPEPDADDDCDTSGGPVSAARRAATAAAGGTMVALGAVMTPLPTPGGLLLVYCGMSVLGTEFPAARKALDTMKGQVSQWMGDTDMGDVGADGAGGDIVHVSSSLEEEKEDRKEPAEEKTEKAEGVEVILASGTIMVEPEQSQSKLAIGQQIKFLESEGDA